MSPLFKKKAKEETSEQQKIVPEKPTEGICAKCGSSKLSFFDDGTGKCNNCGRIFNWRAAITQPQLPQQPMPGQQPQPVSQPPAAQFTEATHGASMTPPPPPASEIPQSAAQPVAVPLPQPPQPTGTPGENSTNEISTFSQPPVTVPPPEISQQPVVQPIVTPSIQAEGGFRRSERIEESLADIKNRVERINDANERYRLEINEIKESIARIESRLHELTALYDAISAQFNPFIDIQIKRETGQNPETATEKIGEELSDAMILDKVACPKCGELIPEDSKMCPKCGATLELSTNPVSPQSEIPQAPVPQIPQVLQQPVFFQQFQGSQPRLGPLLQSIGTDYRSSLLAMRWIEYLLDRVDLNELPQVLDYYRRINWISNEVKADILWKIKGIKIEKKPSRPEAKDGWRLSINDHLKTLMFIEMLRGTQLDKQNLEELEKEMEKLKKSNLEDFYGL
ncbi:MAG: zinc-ribbon domain-containing protein [Thermoplasmata archaeon]|nr:zinc-ribbon domain-containing protein [Thermoplasmata archaeon]